ncbi:b(0,+)-type amino acid transporter 1-like [Babylonia areolata]|uniref:b(0,+)-type amino acid transporter 1-like n=1 Tax=Babylonia areolata TaxID=304850 RepID=UPI003FD1D7A7
MDETKSDGDDVNMPITTPQQQQHNANNEQATTTPFNGELKEKGVASDATSQKGMTSSYEGDMTSPSSEKDDGIKIEMSPGDFEMKRDLGFISSVSIIVGTIVGSGIFVSPKGVLESTGSVGLSLVVWVGAGILALLGGLCYAELGTLIQKSGGEYAYLRAALGNVMAFLFTWVNVLVTRTSSLAIMVLTMAEYITPYFSACGDHDSAKKLIACIACLLVGIINSYSTKLAARVQVLTTFIKTVALVVILVGGIVMLFQGKTSYLSSGFEGSSSNPSIIALAFYDALWAYDGWQNLNYVTEEVKDPGKTLPRANITAVLLVTLLYALTNVSYLTIMSTTELLEADAVAMLWGDRVLKTASVIIPISVIVSTFGSANGTAFTGGRTIFAAARDSNLPEVLSYIHVGKRTPLTSMTFSIGVSLIMISIGDISSLIDFFSFVTWMFYGLTFLSLLVLRYKLRDAPRPYKVPIVIPVVMLCVAVYLVVAPIVDSPQIEFLYAFLFILAGVVVYVPFVRYQLKVPGFDKVTMYVQLLMEVSPTDYRED